LIIRDYLLRNLNKKNYLSQEEINLQRDYKVISGFYSEKTSYEVINRKQFQGKRKIADKTGQRHFKNMKHIYSRQIIFPFGIRIIIPHLPEETTY
jgi:hypothetical protein